MFTGAYIIVHHGAEPPFSIQARRAAFIDILPDHHWLNLVWEIINKCLFGQHRGVHFMSFNTFFNRITRVFPLPLGAIVLYLLTAVSKPLFRYPIVALCAATLKLRAIASSFNATFALCLFAVRFLIVYSPWPAMPALVARRLPQKRLFHFDSPFSSHQR